MLYRGNLDYCLGSVCGGYLYRAAGCGSMVNICIVAQWYIYGGAVVNVWWFIGRNMVAQRGTVDKVAHPASILNFL